MKAMNDGRSNTLSIPELAGFALLVVAFVVLMAVLDLEPQSWASFGLLAVFLALLVGYRYLLRARRRS